MGDEVTKIPATLAGKLAAVMTEIETIKRSGKHGQGYHYTKATDVYADVRPLFGKYNIAFVPSMTDCQEVQKAGGKMFAVVTMLMKLINGDNPSDFQESTWVTNGLIAGPGDDKRIQATATTGIKYFLMSTLLIDSEELGDESDGREHERQQVQSKNALPSGSGWTPRPLPPPALPLAVLPERTGDEGPASSPPPASSSGSPASTNGQPKTAQVKETDQLGRYIPKEGEPLPTITSLGMLPGDFSWPPGAPEISKIFQDHYGVTRDFLRYWISTFNNGKSAIPGDEQARNTLLNLLVNKLETALANKVLHEWVQLPEDYQYPAIEEEDAEDFVIEDFNLESFDLPKQEVNQSIDDGGMVALEALSLDQIEEQPHIAPVVELEAQAISDFGYFGDDLPENSDEAG